MRVLSVGNQASMSAMLIQRVALHENRNAAVSRGVLVFANCCWKTHPSNFRTFVNAVMNRSISSCVL
jgi:hypothetical protein